MNRSIKADKIRIMKNSIKEALFIIFIALFVALVINGIRPHGIRLTDTSIYAVSSDEESIKKIPFQDAKEKFNNRTALFLDARSGEDFVAGHIKGAFSCPVHDLDSWIGLFIEKVPLEQEIITYCYGLDCSLSIELAEELFKAGYETISYLENGWGIWNEMGLPVESGLGDAS